MTQFIVGEVSKNWIKDADNRPIEATPSGLLSTQFEAMIECNLKRGYRLHSFQLHRLYANDSLNETIIAVFEKQ